MREEPRLRVLISAGEVSGDIAAAQTARTIRDRVARAELYGPGRSHMADAGVDIGFSTENLGAVGVTEAVVMAPGRFSSARRSSASSAPLPSSATLRLKVDRTAARTVCALIGLGSSPGRFNPASSQRRLDE